MTVRAPTKKLKGLLKKINPKLKYDENPFDSTTIGKLKAEVGYAAGKKGTRTNYLYTTDSAGRIKTATASPLKLKPKGQERGHHYGSPSGKQKGDEAGHLFADLFQGSGGKENIVAQLRDVNQKVFKDMEASWGKMIRNGDKIDVHIDIDYGVGGRPTGFKITETVNGSPRPAVYVKN